MHTLVIYSSFHHGNTKKIAEKMASELKAELLAAKEILEESIEKSIENYNMIGLGSGIYHGKFSKEILKIAENIRNKEVFLFSTSGSGNEKYNDILEKMLKANGNKIIGSFTCKGYNTYGIFGYLGGKGKLHPDTSDIEEAVDFVKYLDIEKPRARYFFL